MQAGRSTAHKGILQGKQMKCDEIGTNVSY